LEFGLVRIREGKLGKGPAGKGSFMHLNLTSCGTSLPGEVFTRTLLQCREHIGETKTRSIGLLW
jgi:hypothetical protein